MPRPIAAAPAAPTEVTLDRGEEKKNSWRFDAPEQTEGDPAPVMRSAYVSKDTLAALGNPDRIRLSIAAVEVE
jgi:hypothetical protein